MYIPTWLIIVIIAIAIYLFIQFKKKNENQNLSTKEMWDQAEINMQKVLEKSINLEEYLQEERDMVNAMERDMIRLREHYKHDEQKKKEIARDWMDYSNAVAEVKFAREMLDVDWSDNAYENFDERTQESHIVIQEIAERVEKELGKKSASKIVHDKIRQKANAINKIAINGNKKKK